MMADSLKFMVQRSLADYDAFFTEMTRYNTTVSGLNQVEVEATTPEGREKFQKAKRAAEEEERQRLAEEKRIADEAAAAKLAAEEAEKKKKGGKKKAPEPEPEEEVVEAEPAIVDLDVLTTDVDMSERTAVDMPLYVVDLVISNNEIVFSNTPEQLLEAPLKAFNKALESIQNIPQIETFVMEKLFRTKVEAKLASVQTHEDWVQVIYKNVEKNLKGSLEPMNEFLAYFKQFSRLLSLNVDEYINSFSWGEMTTREVRSEIQIHTNALKFLTECLPRTAWLGAVQVNLTYIHPISISTLSHNLSARLHTSERFCWLIFSFCFLL